MIVAACIAFLLGHAVLLPWWWPIFWDIHYVWVCFAWFLSHIEEDLYVLKKGVEMYELTFQYLLKSLANSQTAIKTVVAILLKEIAFRPPSSTMQFSMTKTEALWVRSSNGNTDRPITPTAETRIITLMWIPSVFTWQVAASQRTTLHH